MKRVVIVAALLATVLFLTRRSMLLRGATHGQPYLISTALLLGADVNANGSDGTTPLIASVGARNVAGTRKLIASGARVDQQNSLTGVTPLMVASGPRTRTPGETIIRRSRARFITCVP